MKLPPSTFGLDAVARWVVHEAGASPAAVVAAARRRPGDTGWMVGAGAAGSVACQLTREPAGAGQDVHTRTPFDLASVTKPLTALLLARLEREGLVERAEPLGAFLPEVGHTPSAELPLDLFAAHRAGLDGHRKLWAPLLEGRSPDFAEALEVAASARREDCPGDPPPEGFAPVYSDLGYLLLGAALERRGGAPLDELLLRHVVRPLGLELGSARQWKQRSISFEEAVAPTEYVPFRGGVVRGGVHDENAWALYGEGCAGHAGLFGHAPDVLALGVALLEVTEGKRPEFLHRSELEPALRDRPGGSLLAGFDRRSGETPSSGAHFGPRTFGHLGFTGTSLWVDPEQSLVAVLLTNRVHPTRDALAIRTARPAVHDALVAFLR